MLQYALVQCQLIFVIFCKDLDHAFFESNILYITRALRLLMTLVGGLSLAGSQVVPVGQDDFIASTPKWYIYMYMILWLQY